MSTDSSVFTRVGGSSTAPETAKDPVSVLVEIAKDKDLTNEDKRVLISYANSRFKHRRTMAYISLFTVVASVVFLFVAAYFDGTCEQGQENCTQIMATIRANQTLIGFVEGFLTAIIGAYYGVSSWRPTS